MDKNLNFEYISNSEESRKYYSKVIDELNINSGTLIDFGCGMGQLSILASKRATNCKILGIDLNPPQTVEISGKLEFVQGGLEDLDAILCKENVSYLIFSNCIQYLNINEVNRIVARHMSIQKVFISTAFSKFYWIRFIQAIKKMRLREIIRYFLLLLKSSLVPYFLYANSEREKPPSFRQINAGREAAGLSLVNAFYADIWGDKYPWIGNRNILNCYLFTRKN